MKYSVLSILTIFLLACSENIEETSGSPLTEKEVVKEVEPKSKYDFVIENSCGFDRSMINEKVYSFDSDIEADNALKKIMKLTGLPANFEIRAASVDNACAVIKCDDSGNCDRYILYNQEFMERVKDETSTSYSELAILAHEIAHHLSGHTLANTGSSYDMELEADKFAGFMLYKLGASIGEAKKAYSSLNNNGSATHPPKSARIAAITNGWYDAKRNGETVVSIKTETGNSNPSTTATNKTHPSKRTESQEKVKSEPRKYYRKCLCHFGTVTIVEDRDFGFCSSFTDDDNPCNYSNEVHWYKDMYGKKQYTITFDRRW
jgi:hypothetical protein